MCIITNIIVFFISHLDRKSLQFYRGRLVLYHMVGRASFSDIFEVWSTLCVTMDPGSPQSVAQAGNGSVMM